MKQKFAQAVRILTTPPVFSALMCTLLYVIVPGSFASLGHYLLAIVCLSLLPVLAYPVSYLIPALRRGGRKTQRNLALVFSVLGYLIGFLAAVLDGGAAMEKVVFGTYLISGATLAVCTLLHFKASGHTCGCSGPIAALSIFINPWFLVGYVLLTPIIWSSIRLKRHTALQLLAGCVIPVLAMPVSYTHLDVYKRQGSRFTDMPAAGNWAHAGIDFALKQGLFNGMSSTTFEPDGSMTRAMLVTVLWRLDGSRAPAGRNTFTDVPGGQWYTDAVTWAAENGVVNGVGSGKFEPDGRVTREQIATILFRYAAKRYDTSARADLSVFPDAGRVSAYAREALAWANAAGLVNGTDNGHGLILDPQGDATRAQVAAILMRYVKNIVR